MNIYFVTGITVLVFLATLIVARFKPDAFMKTGLASMMLLAAAIISFLVWPGQHAGYVVFGFCSFIIAAAVAYDRRQQERNRDAKRVPRGQIAGEYCVLVRDYPGSTKN